MLRAILGLAVALFASTTHAAGPALVLDATPLLGVAAPDDGSWRSLHVRLENPDNQRLSGSVVVESRAAWSRSGPALTTEVPFSLGPHGKATLEAPTHGLGPGGASFRVFARDANGNTLSEATLPATHPNEAIVLDLTTPSRLVPLLRNASFPSRRGTRFGLRTVLGSIGVSAALEDPSTGDLWLPERASGYSAVTLVVASGRELSKLDDAEQMALTNWVLAGGALALALDRPEDLAHPLVEALVGARPARDTAPASLSSAATFVVPPEETESVAPGAKTPLRVLRLAPSAELRKRFVGYRGGNLHETPFGAAASYGLGELHLLAFDPRDAVTLADPWTRHKLTALIEQAYDRQPLSTLLHSSATPGDLNIDGVRRELDPNQATRWTIIASAILLLVYAGLAGPVNFYLAARRGRPLRALWQLPLWSAATLCIVMLIGLLGKGVAGRARRLSLFDTGAGMTRAAALRFRGFYASSSRELSVRAGRREHVLDVAGASTDVSRNLLIDRDGPRLAGLRTKPWQTVLIREDGFAELSGGVSVLPVGNDFLIKNRTARDLIGVVVHSPGGPTTYLRRIRDGASARASDGIPLPAVGTPAAPGATAIPLDATRFAATLDKDYPGLGRAWTAIEPAIGAETEWWPADAPVLIAALEGGEGKLTDSGLAVDYDRVLLRVVGEGGAP